MAAKKRRVEIIDLAGDSQEVLSDDSVEILFSAPRSNTAAKRRRPDDAHDDFSFVKNFFPEATDECVRRMLKEYGTAANALEAMAFEGYDRVTSVSSGTTTSSSANSDLDFRQIDADWVTPEYIGAAIRRLRSDFPYVGVRSLQHLQSSQGGVYWKSFEKIMSAIGPAVSSPAVCAIPPHPAVVLRHHIAVKEALGSIGLQFNSSFRCSNLKSNATEVADAYENRTLALEIVWFNQQKADEQEKADSAAAHELNEELAAKDGALLECGCCFGEFAFENLVQCTECHLFCKNCLVRHTEQTLFGNGKTELLCMSSSGSTQCPGRFVDSMLRSALPTKTYEKYAEAQGRDMIKVANLQNIVACFSCQYLVELSSSAGKILCCPRCGKSTCRECGDESHIPLKCDEVEKKDQMNIRLKLEEALTLARVRVCPKCNNKFYKQDGCNKMTCPCGASICYICREDIKIKQYQHFCQVAACNHKNCKGCPLYTDTAADDKLAMYDAGAKENSNSIIGGLDLDRYITAGPKDPTLETTRPIAVVPARPALMAPMLIPGLNYFPRRAVPVGAPLARNIPHRRRPRRRERR